ncbi:MAG: ABC transporter ATP-binding protein, partial [Clostridia bacterium]|nr:ABC transporter ATP-binding protein [Clostridia bacterium]
MLKRFAAYYKPHLLMFSLDMAASLTVSLIGMLYPIMTRTMLNDLIPNRQYKMIVVIGLALLCVYAIRMALQYFIQYQGHVVGVKMQAHMRTDLFRKLESLPYSYYDNNETGKIMSRMTNDLFEVSELAHHGPENLFICSVMVVGSFTYLCTIDWVLTLVIFACVPILVSVSLILRKKMRDAFMESRKSIAEINSALESSISGIRVTKAFTNFDTESKKFERG